MVLIHIKSGAVTVNMPRPFSMPLLAFACLCAVASPAAHASVSTIAVGAAGVFSDPAGSGRVAQVQFMGGTSALTLSAGAYDGYDPATVDGAVGAFNVANIKVAPTGVGVVTESFKTDPGYGGEVRVGSQVTTQVSSATLDQGSGALMTVGTKDSFTWRGTRIAAVLTGGDMTVSNVRYDLVNKQVLADLDGTRDAFGSNAAQSFSQHDAVLWTFTTITGPDALPLNALLAADPKAALGQVGYSVERQVVASNQVVGYTSGGYVGCGGPSGGAYGYNYGSGACYYSAPQPIYGETFAYVATGEIRLDGLQITPLGSEFLSNSLGFRPVATTAFQAVSDYGSVTLKTSYVLGVPEPSSYALMGLGLCLVAGGVRRNQRMNA
jgi:hypothetical protein